MGMFFSNMADKVALWFGEGQLFSKTALTDEQLAVRAARYQRAKEQGREWYQGSLYIEFNAFPPVR